MANARRAAAILEVRGLDVYYGRSHALQGVDLTLDHGVLSVVGRNGMGKTTLCKAIMGLVEPVGTVRYRGRDIAGLRANLVAKAGIGYVPEDRQVFPTLTVRQNLMLGQKRAGAFGRWNFDDVFELFPNLAARQNNPAGVLSGGEQQMLTMCRTLMGDPDLILIDEPTEGLAPMLVEQVGYLLEEIARRAGVGEGRGDKILVFHYKRKKQYKKLQGHRQSFVEVKINEIQVNGKSFKAEK